MYVRRKKRSKSAVHPMKRDELDAIDRVLRGRNVDARDFVFTSERGAKLSRFGFWRIVS